jgi:hypothetical protein
MCKVKYIRNFITALFIWPMKDVILDFSINLDFSSYLIKHFKDLLVNSTGLPIRLSPNLDTLIACVS